MNNDIKVYKTKSVLVKWNWDKIITDIPYDQLEKAMQAPTIKISKWHTIRTNAVNEWYEYNITDELEAWIMEEYPQYQKQLMEELRIRRKEWKRVNKEIIVNILNRKYKK